MPALPTNAAWVAAFQALTVTGVVKYYDEPPASVDISSGYAAFPVLPGSELGTQVSTCLDQSKARNIVFVVVLEAVGQGTNAQNYALIAAAIDNLETALDALTVANFIEYTITPDWNYPIGQSNYLALVADITGRSQI